MLQIVFEGELSDDRVLTVLHRICSRPELVDDRLDSKRVMRSKRMSKRPQDGSVMMVTVFETS